MRDIVRHGLAPNASLFATYADSVVRRRDRLPMLTTTTERSDVIKVARYEGENAHVLRMCATLADRLTDDIAFACVHGSLGTYEEVPYSDFDAFVVIRSDVCGSAARLAHAASELCRAQRIMVSYDPLQHHGWFVLDEAMLMSYPESYFPNVLLSHAKEITPQTQGSLTISHTDETRPLSAVFCELVRGIKSDMVQGKYLRNVYCFKSFLSKVLLLPAAYVQCRDGKGIFKRESFEVAKSDFTDEQWAPIVTASAIRKDWIAPKTGSLRRQLYQLNWWGRIAQRRISAGSVPIDVRSLTGPTFINQLNQLMTAMRLRLGVAQVG